MEKSKKIGIVALCVLTLMIGAAFASAAQDKPALPWSELLSVFITNTETDPVSVSIEGEVSMSPEYSEPVPVSIEGPVNIQGDTEPISVTIEGPVIIETEETSDIKHVEILRGIFGTEFVTEDIIVDLTGYKNLEVNGYIYTTNPSTVRLTWCFEDGTGAYKFLEKAAWGGIHISTPIGSKYLKIIIDNNTPDDANDDLRLILYATK